MPSKLLGYYVNSDDIEKSINETGLVDLGGFGIASNDSALRAFFLNSTLAQKAGLNDAANDFELRQGEIEILAKPLNGYLASAIADFIRQKLLELKISFTFETVMSHPDKVKFLAMAQSAGYRTYLYYVATDDPEINISRVRYRVSQGGHSVPEDKIISRYHKSLDQLMEAIKYTDRAYVFDNSKDGQTRTWLAEITDGQTLEIKTDQLPAWFKRAVLDKIQSS